MLQRDSWAARGAADERGALVHLESVKATLAAFCGTHLKVGAGFLAPVKDDYGSIAASLGVVEACGDGRIECIAWSFLL